MNETGARQQIVEKIKNSNNILVTVSTDPSVDELSAALGLTVLLNNMGKHTTAVFSGQIPAAMDFLDPEKTFANTVDSLRDFIIALDKEKADHLRYKVEGEVVKIFVTPYRTTITSDDLDFSQGDYNIELVLAMGVTKRDNLDQALTAHGRILHDATVATLSVGDMKSELGSVNWREQHASSLGEMLVSVSEALKSEKAIIDEQIATAFLTGIVAATDRFSNKKTSSKAMTVAAQLMAAGANQQLIASKLEEADAISTQVELSSKSQDDNNSRDSSKKSDGSRDLAEGESQKLERGSGKRSRRSNKRGRREDGALVINHDRPIETSPRPADAVQSPEVPSNDSSAPQADDVASGENQEPHDGGDTLEQRGQHFVAQQQSEAAEAAEQNLAEELSKVAPVAPSETFSVEDLQRDVAQASAEVEQAAEAPLQSVAESEPAPVFTPPEQEMVAPEPFTQPAPEPDFTQPEPAPEPVVQEPVLSGAVFDTSWRDTEQPIIGGTLNATTEQAATEKRQEDERSRNRTILTHGSTGYAGNNDPQTQQSPINAAGLPSAEPSLPDPFSQLAPPPESTAAPTSYAPTIEPLSQPQPRTLSEMEQQYNPLPDAQAAVNAALDAAPSMGDQMPQMPFDAPPLPPMDTVSSGFDAPLPPPLPDFSSLPPLPPLPGDDGMMMAAEPERLEDVFGAPPMQPQAPQSQDPGQFRIPGQ